MSSEVQSGLQMYGIIKSLLTIIFLCVAILVTSFYTLDAKNKNYTLANNGEITYGLDDRKSLDPQASINCDPNYPNNNCDYYDEYDVASNHYKFHDKNTNTTVKPTIGKTNIFYAANDPTDYAIGINPYYIFCGVLCMIVLFFIFAVFNLYLQKKYKSYGAVTGGIEAVGDALNFRR